MRLVVRCSGRQRYDNMGDNWTVGGCKTKVLTNPVHGTNNAGKITVYVQIRNESTCTDAGGRYIIVLGNFAG